VLIAAVASEGLSWLIEDGVNGLLFPIYDVDAYVETTRRPLADDSLAQNCIVGCRSKWQAEFSRDPIVAQYMSFFDEIALSSRPLS
jgi:glycosyltransferase involved in cell wall biosynthesis